MLTKKSLKIIKRCLSVVLAVAIIFSSAYAGLSEVDFGGLFAVETKAVSVDDLMFTLNDDGESYFVEDCNTSASGELVIPDSHNGLPVTSISDFAFSWCVNLTSVIIPDSVKSIGNYAFEYCYSLNSVMIPGSVTSVGEAAFCECSFQYAIVPCSVAVIGDGAFTGIGLSSNVFYSGTTVQWEILTNEKNITLSDITIVRCNDYEHNCSGEVYWIAEKQFTCTETGLVSLVCSDCGYVFESVEIDATCMLKLMEVDSDGNISEFEGLNVESPTCVSDGAVSSVCYVCGKEAVGVMPSSDVYHDYIYVWTIDKEPTCTEAGSKSYHCSRCDDKAYITEIEAVGHSYSTEWTVDKAATCTEEGSKSHHCTGTGCEEKADITVIEATGHNHEITDVAASHPHIITYTCSDCGDEFTEDSVSSTCIECNFTITPVDSSSYKLVSYIGSETDVVIPAEYEGVAVTTIANACFKGNASIISVEIEEGVTTIGSLAFMNCSSLEKVTIPASVTSIGTQAFYGFAGTIYCTSGSYAHEYAVANNIKYVLEGTDELEEPIQETVNTRIDYDNFIIRTNAYACKDINEILGLSESAVAVAEASYVYGNLELYGTGTIISVFDGNDYIGDFTLIVEGDVNGDSVCDVLDAMHVALVSNGHRALDGAYAMAADSNSDDVIDVNDYQAVVNKAVA